MKDLHQNHSNGFKDFDATKLCQVRVLFPSSLTEESALQFKLGLGVWTASLVRQKLVYNPKTPLKTPEASPPLCPRIATQDIKHSSCNWSPGYTCLLNTHTTIYILYFSPFFSEAVA